MEHLVHTPEGELKPKDPYPTLRFSDNLTDGYYYEHKFHNGGYVTAQPIEAGWNTQVIQQIPGTYVVGTAGQ